jgi:predicted DNA-binding protein YlxM (UPF0122 family)
MPAKNSKTPKTLEILSLIEQGLSNSEICKLVNCSQVCVSTIKKRNNLPRSSRFKFDWTEIQKFYNEGNSLRDCIKEFKVSQSAMLNATRRGFLKTRGISDSLKERYKKHPAKSLSEERKRKQSETILQKVKNGTWHYSFSKVRTHEFNSKFAGKIKCMGLWEYEYAKYLDANNIEWRRPKEKFYYEFNGLKSGKGYYIPDFYLIADAVYVEIKGYETDKDRAKWKWFPKDLKHLVLKRQDLLNLGLSLSDR